MSDNIAIYNMADHTQAVANLFKSVPAVIKNFVSKNPNFKILLLSNKEQTQAMSEFLHYLDMHLNLQIYGLTATDLTSSSKNPTLAKQLDVAIALELLERSLILPKDMATLLKTSHYQQPRPEGAELTMTFLQALSSISIGIANPIETAWREMVRVIRTGFRTAGKTGVNWSAFFYEVLDKSNIFVEHLLVALYTHQEDVVRLLTARRPTLPEARTAPLSASELNSLRTAYQDIKRADDSDREQVQQHFEGLVNGFFSFEQEDQEFSDSSAEDPLEHDYQKVPRETDLGMSKGWLQTLLTYAGNLKVVRAITELERRPHLRTLFQNFDVHAGARAQEAIAWLVDREALKLVDLRHHADSPDDRLHYREDSLKQLIVDFAPKWISTWMTPAIIRSHPDFTKLLEMHADRRLQDVMPDSGLIPDAPTRSRPTNQRRERKTTSSWQRTVPLALDNREAVPSQHSVPPSERSGRQQQPYRSSSSTQDRQRSNARQQSQSRSRQQSGRQPPQQTGSNPYRPPAARSGPQHQRGGNTQRRVNFETPPEARYDLRARPQSAGPRVSHARDQNVNTSSSPPASTGAPRRSNRLRQNQGSEDRVAMADAGFHAQCSRLSADRLRRTQAMLARGGEDEQVRFLLMSSGHDTALAQQRGPGFPSNNAGDGPTSAPSPSTSSALIETPSPVVAATSNSMTLATVATSMLMSSAPSAIPPIEASNAVETVTSSSTTPVTAATSMLMSSAPSAIPPIEASNAVEAVTSSQTTPVASSSSSPPSPTPSLVGLLRASNQTWDKGEPTEGMAPTQRRDKVENGNTHGWDDAWNYAVLLRLGQLSHVTPEQAEGWRNSLLAFQGLLAKQGRTGTALPQAQFAAQEIVRRRFEFEYQQGNPAALEPGELCMEAELPELSEEDADNLRRYVARSAPPMKDKAPDEELRYVNASYNRGWKRMSQAYLDPRNPNYTPRVGGMQEDKKRRLQQLQGTHPGRDACTLCWPTPTSSVNPELLDLEPHLPPEVLSSIIGPQPDSKAMDPNLLVISPTGPAYSQKVVVTFVDTSEGQGQLRKWVQPLFDPLLLSPADRDQPPLLLLEEAMFRTHCVVGSSESETFTSYSPPGFRTCRDAEGVVFSVCRRPDPLAKAEQWRQEAHPTKIVAYVLDPRYHEPSYLLRWEIDGHPTRPLYSTIRASMLLAARQIPLLNDFLQEQQAISLPSGTPRPAYRCPDRISPELSSVIDLLRLSDRDVRHLEGHTLALTNLLIRALVAHSERPQHPEFTNVQAMWSTIHPVMVDAEDELSSPHPCSEGWTFLIGGISQMAMLLAAWNRHLTTGRVEFSTSDSHLRCCCLLHRDRNCETLPCPPAFLHLSITPNWQELRSHFQLIPAIAFVRCRTTQLDYEVLNRLNRQVRLRFDQYHVLGSRRYPPSVVTTGLTGAAAWLNSLPKARGAFRSWKLYRPLRDHQRLFRFRSEATEEQGARMQAQQRGKAYRSNNAGDGPDEKTTPLHSTLPYLDSDSDSVPPCEGDYCCPDKDGRYTPCECPNFCDKAIWAEMLYGSEDEEAEPPGWPPLIRLLARGMVLRSGREIPTATRRPIHPAGSHQRGVQYRSNSAGDGPGHWTQGASPSRTAPPRNFPGNGRVTVLLSPPGSPRWFHPRAEGHRLEETRPEDRTSTGGSVPADEVDGFAPHQRGEVERQVTAYADATLMVSAFRHAALPRREPRYERGIFEEALAEGHWREEWQRAVSQQQQARRIFMGESTPPRKRRRRVTDGRQLGPEYRSNNAGDGPGCPYQNDPLSAPTNLLDCSTPQCVPPPTEHETDCHQLGVRYRSNEAGDGPKLPPASAPSGAGPLSEEEADEEADEPPLLSEADNSSEDDIPDLCGSSSEETDSESGSSEDEDGVLEFFEDRQDEALGGHLTPTVAASISRRNAPGLFGQIAPAIGCSWSPNIASPLSFNDLVGEGSEQPFCYGGPLSASTAYDSTETSRLYHDWINRQSAHDRTPLPTVWADVLPRGPRSLIALVDTGSSQNLLDTRAAGFLEQRGRRKIKLPAPILAQTAEPGHHLEFTHYMMLPFQLQGSTTKFEAAFMITDLPKFDMLLGVNWAHANRVSIHSAHSCLSWPVGKAGREFLLYSLEAILRLQDPGYLDLLLRKMPPRQDVIGFDGSGKPLDPPTASRLPPRPGASCPPADEAVLWTEAQRSCEAEDELEALRKAACAHPTKLPDLKDRPRSVQMHDKMLRDQGKIPVYAPPDDQPVRAGHAAFISLFLDAEEDLDTSYIFHPTHGFPSETHTLAYPRALFRPKDSVFKVQVMNFGTAAQRVVPGDIVGYAEPKTAYKVKDSNAEIERQLAERGLWKLAEEGLDMSNEELEHASKVWTEIALSMDTSRLTHAQVEVLRAIVFRFHSTWTTSTDAPRASTKIPDELLMKLELKDGAKPVNIKRFRKSTLEREHIREFVEDALKKGIIKPTRSPWSSPMVLVKKKDSDKMRPCIDYRAVNQQLVVDSFPIPLIKDILDNLHGKAWFTLADARSGFHQMPLADDEESKRITAFHTPFGSYQWEVVPMGLVNSPSAFQRMVNFVLRGLGDQVAMAYLDDVVVMGSSFEEHALNLYLTLQRLEEFDLRLAANKTHLCQEELLILGWIVSGNDVRPNPVKIQAVQDWLPPDECKTEKQKRKSVKGLLGLAGFYRRAIKDFARIASPLTDLTKTGKKGEPANPFVWTDEAQTSFLTLKQALLSAPLLRHPDLSKKFLIDVDACKDGVGAVLSQVFEDGQEHPCAYFSKRYSEAEQKYASTELEALGVLKTIEHWRPYIHGQPFDMRTDSMNVLWGWLRNQDKGRLGRWAATLSQYEGLITFVSRKGRLNGNADGLSRRPHADDSEEERDDEKLLGPHPTPASTITPRTPLQHGVTYEQMRESLKLPPVIAVAEAQETEAEIDARIDRLQATAFASENPAEVLPFADLMAELRATSATDQTVVDIRRQLLSAPDPSDATTDVQKLEQKLLRQYRWKNDLLWTRWSTDAQGYAKPQSTRWLVYVPEKSRASVIATVHDRSAHQHLGSERSQKLIATAFYWPGLHLQVMKHISACAWCQKYSDAKHGSQGPLQKVMRPEAPNRTVSIDLVGPFQLDAEPGVPQYALTMVDVHSNLAAACPISGLLTSQVIQAFETAWLHVYGPPQTIISDRGTQFESREFHAMLDQYGIKAKRTTFAHPQANPVERIHRWLSKGLAILVAKYGERWPRYLTRVLYAYNTTNHHGTIVTPYGLFFRRNAPTALLGIALLGNPEAELLDDFQQQTLLEMRSQLEQQRHKNFVANAKRRPSEPVQFPCGEWVMVKARKAGKLSSGWNGPYVVLGHTGLNTVRVRRKKWGKMASDVVNVNKLRLFKLSDRVQDPAALPLNLPAGLRIDMSSVPEAGWGILATSALRAGTLLGRYKGEWLTAVAYHRRYPKDDPQFVVEAADSNGNPAYIDARDPTRSNWLRYVQCPGPNESPNCELRAGGKGEEPSLISLRPIQPQEELLWDYGPSYRWPSGLPLDSANTKLLGDLARNRQAISDGKRASKAKSQTKPTRPPLRRPPPTAAAVANAMRQGSVSQFDAETSPLPELGSYVIGAHPDVPNNLWCLGKVLQHEEDNGESYVRVQVYGTYSANSPLHRRQFRPAWVDNKDGKRVYSTRRNPSYVPWSVYIHSTDIWIAAVQPIAVRNGVQLPKDVALLIPRILDQSVMLVWSGADRLAL